MLSRIPHGFASSEDLTLLAEVLNDYCRDAGIESGSSDHEDAAGLLMSIFGQGGDMTTAALRAALDRRALPEST